MPGGPLSVKDLIRQEAAAQGVPEELAMSIAEQESGFNPTLTNPTAVAGGQHATGTFQLLPSTGQMLGVDPNDPAANIHGGVKYLRQLLDRYNGDLDKVIGTYGGVVNDTTYVPQVKGRFPRWYRGPQATAPETPRPPTPPWFDSERKFFHEATQSINPVNIYEGVTGLAKGLWNDPAAVAKGFYEAHAQPVREGYYEGAIPLLGPRLAEAHKFVEEGEYAKAAGAAVDVGAQIFGPKILGKTGLRLTPRIFRPRLTAAEQAAVDFGMARDLTMDVPTVSGSKFARNITQASEATPLGSGVNSIVKGRRQVELPAIADDLAGQVHPHAITPGEAGLGLRDSAGDFMANQQTTATYHYGVVEQAANDPRFLQRVQTGTTTGNAWTPQGTLVPTSTPIFEMVQAPTNIRAIKAAVAPVLAEIEATMPLGQQQFSKSLLALRNLMALRDFEPVLVVERNLGAIKRVARGAEHPALRSLEQGTAAHTIAEVSAAIDQTMAQLGPQAQQSLAAGRAATRAKWAAEDIFDQVNKEPVAGFNAVVGTRDIHAEALAEIARVAPGEIRPLGRAVLENIFEKARGLEEGWSRNASVANAWENLGPQTKQILYGPLTEELDNFFLLQKMLAQRSNPSGTALVGMSVGSLVGTAADPFWGITTTIGAGGVAALMNSRLGIHLLTEGLTIAPGTAKAAAWAALVTRAANDLAEQGQSSLAEPPPPPPTAVATPPPRRQYLGGSRWREDPAPVIRTRIP